MTGVSRDDTTAPRDERVVFRPHLLRVLAYLIGALILVASVTTAIVLPPATGGAGFTSIDRGGFVVFGLLLFLFCHREASVQVIAAPQELIVRNLFATRHLEWAEVVGVSFPQGNPWPHLDLSDGETLALMGIQRTDRKTCIPDARHLARIALDRGVPGPGPGSA